MLDLVGILAGSYLAKVDERRKVTLSMELVVQVSEKIRAKPFSLERTYLR